MKANIYLGPNRPFGLPIMKNSILADEPEKVYPALAPLFEKNRAFKKLFVPVGGLAEAKRALANPASPLAIIASEIKKAGQEA